MVTSKKRKKLAKYPTNLISFVNSILCMTYWSMVDWTERAPSPARASENPGPDPTAADAVDAGSHVWCQPWDLGVPGGCLCYAVIDEQAGQWGINAAVKRGQKVTVKRILGRNLHLFDRMN